MRGEYLVAAERFLSAYEHKPYPAFLFNVAVSFEKAKQLEKARDYFTRYLEKDPNANDAAQVKLRLDVINQLLAPPPPPPRRRRHRRVAPMGERRPPPRRPPALTEARPRPERRPPRHRPPARRRSRRRRPRRRPRCRC